MSSKETKKQKGSTLLEYTMAAAVLIGVVWGAMTTLGGSLKDVLDSVGAWATNRAGQIDDPDMPGN